MIGANGESGKIKLTWQQIVWGISLLAAILLTYSDIKNKINVISLQMAQIYTKSENDRVILELRRNDAEMKTNLKIINKKLRIDLGD